jgi:hypothetical protein
MEITINLAESQIKYLKLFAANHFPGANDNLCTHNPIHVVQDNRHRIIPYSIDIEEFMNAHDLVFMDRECCSEFVSEVDFIKQYYAWKDKEPPKDLVSFKEAQYKLVTKNGWRITSWYEYFKHYNVEEYHMGWRQDDWQNIAFFFILEEARRYIKYQGHNLRDPRTFTFSAGYGNEGEYQHFWRLLLDIGKQLNEMENKDGDQHEEAG